jgi:hypothetical protein
MSNLKSAFSQSLFAQSATQAEELGAKRIEADGRIFRYAKAGGALVAGKAVIGAAEVANHINLAATNVAKVGATSISQTVGATAVTVDQYKGGYFDVNDATGEGYRYRIESNTAAVSGGTTVLQLADPIRVALVATTSEVSLIPNLYSGVTHSAVEESMCAGVTVGAVASGSYGWVQTGGDCLCLHSGTAAVGTNLTLGPVAGSVIAVNATLDIDQPFIGYKTMGAGVDTEYKPIFLNID